MSFGDAYGNRTLSVDGAKEILNEMWELGQDTLVIMDMAWMINCSSTSPNYTLFQPYTSDRLISLLDEAKRLNIGVYVGTLLTMHCHGILDGTANGEALRSSALTIQNNLASQIFANFKDHSAFKGWYISDEPNLDPNLTAAQKDILWSGYYAKLVGKIRNYDRQRPIVIAPPMGDVIHVSPRAVAASAKEFMIRTGVNIQAWQDGVGAKRVNFSTTSNRANVGDYYKAISGELSSIGGVLWSDIELFDDADGNYKPTIFSRVTAQLLHASSVNGVSKRLAFNLQHFMTNRASDITRHASSERLDLAYRNYLLTNSRSGAGQTYWFEGSLPSPSYGDEGSITLFDGVSADPLNFLDPRWVGIRSGLQKIAINFNGSQKNVAWIAIRLHYNSSVGIYVPQKVSVQCHTSSGALSADIPVPSGLSVGSALATRGVVVQNLQKLSFRNCVGLTINLGVNSHWSFVDEVEYY